MKQLSVLVLWAACVGLSMQQWYPSTTASPNNPCNNYTTLRQHQRNVDYNLTVNGTNSFCDALGFDEGQWYRFDNNVTGGKIPEYCVSTASCGKHIPIWMSDTHPTESSPGPKSVRVCGHKYNCCGWSTDIQVKYCPAKSATDYPYYVYQLKNPPDCNYGYCTTKACKLGYTRNMTDHCVDIDECLNDPCWYGMCVNTEGSYKCISDGSETTTVPSYTRCAELLCLNGSCVEHPHGSYCACEYGYTGDYCETYLPCSKNPCGPGQCHEIADGTFECTCPPGVYGQNCSYVDCDHYPCKNGECISLGYTSSYCSCLSGFEGVLCERSIYESSTLSTKPVTQACTCYNGGNCVYSYSRYYCDCPNGYTGEKCESAVTCGYTNMTCLNGGSCMYSSYSGYYCNCQYGTYGEYCQFWQGYNSTTTTTAPAVTCGNHNMTCLNGGFCEYSYYSGYYCNCQYGTYGEYCQFWEGYNSTTTTTRPHETCGDLNTTCLNGGSCMYSYYSGYYCSCPYWSYGDYCQFWDYYNSTTAVPDKTCGDLNTTCLNGGSCMYSYYSGYYCSCPYWSYGEYCQFWEYYNSTTAVPAVTCGNLNTTCFNGGSCLYSFYSGYYCSCPYWTYGEYCQYWQSTTEVTTDKPWYETTTTTSPSWPYSCSDYPCHNGGWCVEGDYSEFAYCVCPKGYTGRFCEYSSQTSNTSCVYNPCLNGGSCFTLDYGGYVCVCPADGMGYNCEHSPSGRDPCRDAYCGYGSTCLPGMWTDDYSCLCGPDYTGPHCDISTDCGCVHGNCSLYPYEYDYPVYSDGYDYPVWTTTVSPWDWGGDHSTFCICEPGYTDPYCDTPMTSCDQSPCLNGGSCQGYYFQSGFYCTCPTYYDGDYCETGVWGEWQVSTSCSRSCGGGYKTKTRTCLAGYGRCQGRSVQHTPCNTLPCPGDGNYPGVDVEISNDDLPMVVQNEANIPEIVAYIINLYCVSHLEECCGCFGYSPNTRSTFGALVTESQCFMNFADFKSVSFVIRVSAYTTKYSLSQLCLVTDYNYNQYNQPVDEVEYADSYDKDIYSYTNEDVLYLSSDLLLNAVESNIDTIKRMTDVDILSVNHAALGQDDDDNDDDDDDEEGDGGSHHSKALVIGLSVALSLLSLIVIGGVIVLLWTKCNKSKTSREFTPPTQPVPAVSRPQFMYQQPTTPHDLFLASGGNGMPPAYQQVVGYSGTGAAPNHGIGLQNPMYGGIPQTKNNVLPPINPPVDGGAKKPEGGQLDTVTNPAPPSDTVLQAPCVPPAGRLPPIQHSNA